MKFRNISLLIVLLITSCTSAQGTPSATRQSPGAVVPTAAGVSTTRAMPTPKIERTLPPSAEGAATAFLQAWQADDYEAMYKMLTSVSRDALPLEKFTQRYKDAAIGMTLQKLSFNILSVSTNPASAQVAYRVTYKTKMLGDLPARDITMNLTLEQGAWRIQWDDGLIMPELHGGNKLTMDIKSPTRGNIYDRNGNAVAAANDVFALGIVRSLVDPDHESELYGDLSQLTGKPPDWIRGMVENSSSDYVPVGEAPRDAVLERYNALAGLSQYGLRMNEYTSRFYYSGGIAPHVTGYVQAISDKEVDKYLREGFRLDDRVGKAGLELWGEGSLLGQRGASLYVTDPNGVTLTRLGQVDSRPSQSITMTIDSKLQLEAQRAIAGFNGALVVLERNTGRVLAMVSSPGFDPNAFEYQNYNSGSLIGQIFGDGKNRLYNRASGNGYPLGSVFKIVTIAAALESGLFTPESTLDCQYDWTEIPGLTLTDWTKEKEVPPSGVLTLPEGLMRSCNPWFYHIGYTLYKNGHEDDISKMARAFGLGSPTGVQGLDFDEAGNIPDPTDEQSAALIAIGQDKVLVNPLQVARFVAAVGNGGTLYRPQVVEKIADPDGNPSFEFKPDAQGKLPVKPENLAIIRDAMRRVVSDKRGTAVRAFSGLNVPVYGKTGTAQNDSPGNPHAWFAGFTDTGRTDKPDIAFAVVAEYAGEGSDIAAPIARRLLEVYYMGQAQKVYPWESRPNVTRTPTPLEGETPQAPSSSGGSGSQPGPVPTENPFGNINIRTATPSP